MDPVTSPSALPAPPPPPLPPPPAPSGPAFGVAGSPPQAGQLTNGWRFVTGLGWAFVIVAYTAVWKTSRELGLNTWWLGPLGDPQPAFVTMLPFIAPLVMVLFTVNNSRLIPWLGLAAAAVLGAIAGFDLVKVPRLGLVELAIASAGALLAVASLAGRYRA